MRSCGYPRESAWTGTSLKQCTTESVKTAAQHILLSQLPDGDWQTVALWEQFCVPVQTTPHAQHLSRLFVQPLSDTAFRPPRPAQPIPRISVCNCDISLLPCDILTIASPQIMHSYVRVKSTCWFNLEVKIYIYSISEFKLLTI